MSAVRGRDYAGVRFFRTRETYYTKKDAEEAAAWFRDDGCAAKIERSREKFKGKYAYRIYIHDKPAAKPKLPPCLVMQSELAAPASGQTFFNVGSPNKKGKKAGKKNVKKREKNGSGSLAMFGVMPSGQKTIAEMAAELMK